MIIYRNLKESKLLELRVISHRYKIITLKWAVFLYTISNKPKMTSKKYWVPWRKFNKLNDLYRIIIDSMQSQSKLVELNKVILKCLWEM